MSSASETLRAQTKTAAAIVLLLAAWLVVLRFAGGRSAAAAPSPASSAGKAAAASPKLLRVCADPNNLPFSNAHGEGFENRIAELVARRLGRKTSYTFWPQRRGFVRSTLGAGACDVVIGVPARYELTENTQPYYRSSYVLVTRAADGDAPGSLDDPALRKLRIGVHIIGDDYSNVPPAEALARRGIVENVHGYSIYGDYSQPNPPQALLTALTSREIDLAIAWGPLAGASVKRSHGQLRLAPVTPKLDPPALAMTFAISMGVKRGNHALRQELDRALSDEKANVRAVLDDFGVPLELEPPKEEPL